MQLPTKDILRHYSIDFSESSDDELLCRCPFHNDDNPSCYINWEKGVFLCQSCGAKGDIYSFIARSEKASRAKITSDIASSFNISDERALNPKSIERFHRAIFNEAGLLEELYSRGVTPDLITYYRLGVDKDRITIPIKNAQGQYIAIRRYKPGSKTNKMISQKGRGQNKLYPIEQIHFDTILYTGGEMKAIVAAYHLNTYSIGAITGTSGESNITVDMAKQFKGKIVYVCMDIDDAGLAAAKKVASVLIRFTKKIHIVNLPLDKEKHPTGDINDYVMAHGALTFEILSQNSEEFKLVEPTYEANGQVCHDVSLADAVGGEYIGSRISVEARVVALLDKPYEIPKVVEGTCDKSEAFCAECPMNYNKNVLKVPNESKSIISMCGSPENIQLDEIKKAVNIPVKCKSFSAKITEYYTIQEARLDNTLKMTERSSSQGMQSAWCIGNNAIEANSEYTFVGRNYPHHRDQSASFIFSSSVPVENELASYEPTNLEQLEIFHPDEWESESVINKLHTIYEDFEANVTYIFERRRIHLAMDLAYHSPLQFRLDDKMQKGWLEVLIVGDSSIGKTETAQYLRDHYKLGKRSSCKGATTAGLLGGLQSINGKFFVTWGVIPTYDRQLVILEELSGAKSGSIQSLTDMRSTGIAELTKIEKRSTHARTRLIGVSNCTPGKQVGSYTFGIQAIIDLIKAPEDIRRFDLCLVESQEDISTEKLTRLQRHRPQIEHKYTTDLCQQLVLWIWSLSPDDIEFDKEALDLLGEVTTKLCTKFTEICPILDKGSTRYKIARLSAALAGRTFSTKDGKLFIRKCHIEAVYTIVDSIYSDTTIGYKEFSDSVHYQNTLQNPQMIEVQIRSVPNPRDFVSKMLHAAEIEPKDIEDWTGYDMQAARSVISLLVRKNALIRHNRIYKKNEAFNRFLAQLKDLPEERL